MRHGILKIVEPISGHRNRAVGQSAPFMLLVGDDEGDFLVIGDRWVHERWAGAAPVEPTTADHLQTVEQIMLREADKRRHRGSFDLDHPMTLEQA